MNGKTYIVVVTVLYGRLLSSAASNTETNDTGSTTTMDGPTSATMEYASQSLHGDRIFNVAFQTNESSTRLKYPPAFPAFDNDIGPDPHDSNGTAVCSHTDIEYEPWWYVDIQDLHTIKHVVLHNRQEQPGRLEGAQVRVGKSENNLKQNTACGPPVSKDEADVPAGIITLRCEPGTVGNIVSVQLENRTQYLTLCEVKLYGTIYTEYLTTLVVEQTEPKVTAPSYIGHTTTMQMDGSTSVTMESYISQNFFSSTTKIGQVAFALSNLAEGEFMVLNYGNLRGFIARFYRNGTLHERKLTEENDSVSVALQIAPNKDPQICIALIGKPERYDNLTDNAVTNGLDNNTTKVKVGTLILEVSNYDSNRNEISAGINIEFKYPNSQFNSSPKGQPTCAFFNETLSYWSTTGCETNSATYFVKCTCDHTTSYAILFQTSESDNDAISEPNKIAMSVITYIGLIISTVFLLAALVIQNILPELRKSTRFQILTHLIIGAILSNIAFLTLELAHDQKILCYIYAAILHYSLLVVFVWMMIFSADLYAKVFYSFANHRKRMQWSKFVGWALPFFVVLITVAVTRKQYADLKNCWLNTNYGTVWAFIGPATLVVLINIALITRVLIEVSKKSRSANVTEKRKLDDLRYVAVRASLLLPVIGVTWVFGIMVLFDGDQVVFMYIFVITNTFQGALIWLTQFFWSREVKNAWTSMKKKRHYSLKKVNSRKEKDSNKEFNGIDECAIFPPNSTIDNTYSMTSKKSLTVSSDLTFTTFGTKN